MSVEDDARALFDGAVTAALMDGGRIVVGWIPSMVDEFGIPEDRIRDALDWLRETDRLDVRLVRGRPDQEGLRVLDFGDRGFAFERVAQ